MYDPSKMCFMTVANRPYQQYVPWFLYFLNRAYPEAHKLVLLDEAITEDVRQMVSLLSGNFEVRERSFPEYTQTNANTIKCLRWLIYEPAFEQYECMSIGDVDMAIYVETPSYMDQHLSHCDLLGISYSNFVRPTLPRRVSGIHVIKPTEWFNAIVPMIEKYRPLLASNSIRLPQDGFNEQLLLRMITESKLSCPPSNLRETYMSSIVSSHHHGTHIRLAECGGINSLQRERGYLTHRSEVIAAVGTPLFKQLASMSPGIGCILRLVAASYKISDFMEQDID